MLNVRGAARVSFFVGQHNDPSAKTYLRRGRRPSGCGPGAGCLVSTRHQWLLLRRPLCRGNDCYVRIQGDGYFSYSPGHEVPEYRKFTLRRTADGWDVMGLPHSDRYWSPLEGENKVIGRLRFRNGALYESWGSSTNWTRLPRAYNVWRIWLAKLLNK